MHNTHTHTHTCAPLNSIPNMLLLNDASSFVGFLLGVTVAGSVGYYYLLEEYNSASDSLLSSVQELQTSTEKVRKSEKSTSTTRLFIAIIGP